MERLRDVGDRLKVWDLEAGDRWDEWKHRMFVTYIDRWHKPGYNDNDLDFFIGLILVVMLFILAVYVGRGIGTWSQWQPPIGVHHQPGSAW